MLFPTQAYLPVDDGPERRLQLHMSPALRRRSTRLSWHDPVCGGWKLKQLTQFHSPLGHGSESPRQRQSGVTRSYILPQRAQHCSGLPPVLLPPITILLPTQLYLPVDDGPERRLQLHMSPAWRRRSTRLSWHQPLATDAIPTTKLPFSCSTVEFSWLLSFCSGAEGVSRLEPRNCPSCPAQASGERLRKQAMTSTLDQAIL